MVIGGTGGASVTGAGGMLTGYEETFFPVVVTVGTESVDTAFRENKPIRYSAFARIRNVAETAWITISDVEYFQVAGKEDGSGTANATVRDTDKWSVDGTEYPALLSPSARLFQIFLSMVISGTEYEIMVFNGQITNFSETHGQGGSAISLVARSTSIGLETRKPSGLTRQTAYRLVTDEILESGLFGVGQVPVILFNDYEIETVAEYNSLFAMISAIAPVAVAMANRQTGGIIISKRGETTSEDPSFTLNDNMQVSLNRSFGSAGITYNTILVAGTSGSSYATQEVSDVTDVARRGNVRYPYTYGNWRRALADNVTDAEAWISEMLRGKISVGIQTNPFIGVGTVLGFDSSRLFITSGRGRVGAFTIQYRRGDTSMQLTSVAVLT